MMMRFETKNMRAKINLTKVHYPCRNNIIKTTFNTHMQSTLKSHRKITVIHQVPARLFTTAEFFLSHC